MWIVTIPSGPFETNAYVVGCEKSGVGAIIDPAPGSYRAILETLEKKGCRATSILLTHSHWDHIADVAPLKKELKVPVMVHALDRANLERPGADQLPYFVAIEGVVPDREFVDGEEVEVGQLCLQVIHTPGHTPGGVCFYSADERVLFSGDTLFKRSIGTLSLPTAEPEKMWSSLERLRQLPAETVVYPGHGPSTTLGEESWLGQAKELFNR